MCHRFILDLIDLKLLQSIFFVDCKKNLDYFADWSDLFHMYMWERANWSSHTLIFWKRFRLELFNMDLCRIQPRNLSDRAALQGETGVSSSLAPYPDQLPSSKRPLISSLFGFYCALKAPRPAINSSQLELMSRAERAAAKNTAYFTQDSVENQIIKKKTGSLLTDGQRHFSKRPRNEMWLMFNRKGSLLSRKIGTCRCLRGPGC